VWKKVGSWCKLIQMYVPDMQYLDKEEDMAGAKSWNGKYTQEVSDK
jgi:hypothetical protein